jgi:UDP-3-O-[3-hydroxymyristoyl] glucosamine N-acyltransferase
MPELIRLATLIAAELQGDERMEITGVNSWKRADSRQITFMIRDDCDLSQMRAGALIVKRGSSITYPNRLLVDDPKLAFAALLAFFHPYRPHFSGISPQAVVAGDAQIGARVAIGPFSCVGPGCTIGEGTEIHSGVHFYRDVTIGKQCLIQSRVVIRENCQIGDHVVIQPGAVIGADGFGFSRQSDGRPVKIPQIGRVVIGDYCEIGANACIDRSTIEETVLAENVKLDNQVQIGHNVTIGRNTVISAQTGVSGSTEIGANVLVGGQVGIADHIRISDGVMIAGRSGVTGSIKSSMVVSGYPHQEITRWRKTQAILRNIAELRDKVLALEREVFSKEEI